MSRAEYDSFDTCLRRKLELTASLDYCLPSAMGYPPPPSSGLCLVRFSSLAIKASRQVIDLVLQAVSLECRTGRGLGESSIAPTFTVSWNLALAGYLAEILRACTANFRVHGALFVFRVAYKGLERFIVDFLGLDHPLLKRLRGSSLVSASQKAAVLLALVLGRAIL